MWHEARRQEKKIRGLMVDYQRRAERRRHHYEQIKLDPNQFLRVHGIPLKVHLDPAIALAAEGPQSMQPWQGNAEIMIDRFDVRSHLDFIPDNINTNEKLSGEEAKVQRKANYEAYRILVQNEVAGVSEEQNLKQLYIDEQYGPVDEKRKIEEEKKKILAEKKAAIGFSYDDDSPGTPFQPAQFKKPKEDSDDSDFDECDLDNVLDIKKLTSEQTKLLNEASHTYGMQGHDYSHFLKVDKEEAEAIRMAKLFEEEKAQFSGRKSRRERRAFKEKRLAGRPISPPSYAAREAPKFEPVRKSSSSRSPSPVSSAAVSMQFITSFGGSDDEGGAIHGPDLPAHLRLQPSKGSVSTSSLSRFRLSESPKLSTPRGGRSRYSSSRSRSRSRSRRRYGRSRSRSRSRDFRRSRSGSRRNRRYSRSISRSRSRSRRGRSRSRDRRSRSTSITSSSCSESPSPTRDRPPSPPIKHYRRASLSSSSDSSSDSEKEEERRKMAARDAPSDRYKKPEPLKSLSGSKHGSSTSKGRSSSHRLTPQERLKIRMQRAISKQQRADAKARERKVNREERQRLNREDELRAMAIDLRRREREKRHKERMETEESETWMGGRRSHSSSSSGSSSPETYRRRRSRSRSQSDSPRRRSEAAKRLVDY